MITLNKHVKWRKDNKKILICDCKRLIDLKLNLEEINFMNRLQKGICERDLSKEEMLLINDFKKLKLLSKLSLRRLKKDELIKSFKILDTEINKRPRDNKFLIEKYSKFPQFFIGLFLDKEIIGVIFGFPREDYLLISEIAVDSKFKNRGFGKKLVNMFEAVAKGKYNQINVGARDDAINFYLSLNYNPILLIQYKKNDYPISDFKRFNILNKKEDKNNYIILEIKAKEVSKNFLKRLRKKYPRAHIQYIFTKKIC